MQIKEINSRGPTRENTYAYIIYILYKHIYVTKHICKHTHRLKKLPGLC